MYRPVTFFLTAFLSICFAGCDSNSSDNLPQKKSTTTGDSSESSDTVATTKDLHAIDAPIVRQLIADVDYPTLDNFDTNSNPVPCIAVRGLLSQTKSLTKQHLLDLEMQRAHRHGTHADDDDPEWETISEEQLVSVLLKSNGIAADSIPMSAQCTVVTMPLPKRTDGNWDDRVSHPQLKENQILVRAIDFDVAEGSSYRYRIRLRYKLGSPMSDSGDYELSEDILQMTDEELSEIDQIPGGKIVPLQLDLPIDSLPPSSLPESYGASEVKLAWTEWSEPTAWVKVKPQK